MSVPSLPPTAFDEQAAVADIAGIEPRGRLGFLRSSSLRKPSMLFGLTVLVIFVLVAIFAPFLEPYDPRTKTGAVYEPPSIAHWLGTDDGGADMLSLVIAGSRVSLIVGFAAAPTGERKDGIGRNEWDVGTKLALTKTLPAGLLGHLNVGYTYVGRGKDDTLFAKIAGVVRYHDKGRLGRTISIEPVSP